MLQNFFAPPIISKKIRRNNVEQHNSKRLNDCHVISNIPGGEGRKEKNHQAIALFVVDCLV